MNNSTSEQLINQNRQNQVQNKKAFILGASGAIGRVMVEEMCQSNSWEEISVIVRRELPQWKQIKGNNKLKIIQKENLDSLQNKKEWEQKLQGYTNIFCVLGSRVKNGKDTFIKVDYTYCLWGAELAQVYNIPHFTLLTSDGANSKSSFLYLKTKGQIEDAVKKLNIQRISIFQPGFIKNRDNDKRCIEQFFSCLCCCGSVGIQASHLGFAIIREAEMTENLNKQQIQIYSNKQIQQIYYNSKHV